MLIVIVSFRLISHLQARERERAMLQLTPLVSSPGWYLSDSVERALFSLVRGQWNFPRVAELATRPVDTLGRTFV